MKMKQEIYERISEEIFSATSPVGIDAKKTHIIIIKMLEDIDKRLENIEEELKHRKSEK